MKGSNHPIAFLPLCAHPRTRSPRGSNVLFIMRDPPPPPQLLPPQRPSPPTTTTTNNNGHLPQRPRPTTTTTAKNYHNKNDNPANESPTQEQQINSVTNNTLSFRQRAHGAPASTTASSSLPRWPPHTSNPTGVAGGITTTAEAIGSALNPGRGGVPPAKGTGVGLAVTGDSMNANGGGTERRPSTGPQESPHQQQASAKT